MTLNRPHPPHWPRRAALGCLAALLTLALVGCGGAPKADADARRALDALDPNLANPVSAARSLVELLELQATHPPRGDAELAKKYEQQLLALVDQESLYGRYQQRVARPEPAEKVLPEIVGRWPALIANYVGGFDFAGVVGPLPTLRGNGVTLYVPAAAENSRAHLRCDLTAAMGAKPAWRTSRLEFVAASEVPAASTTRPTENPPTATQPTAAPATQPAAP